jgi:hypothetical protein
MISGSFYGSGTGTCADPTRYTCDTTSSYFSYTVTYYKLDPLPLKKLMKIWAAERMRTWWSDFEIEQRTPQKVFYDRPVPLRGVKLNGHGWAI